MRRIGILVTLSAGVFLAGCDDSGKRDLPQEYYSGGATTVFVQTSEAFSTPAANLDGEYLETHMEGDEGFEAEFVAAPAPDNSGLGPLFNRTSCEGCHTNDGRGLESLLLRISVPGTGAHGGPLSVVNFGGQLQDQAVIGTSSEGGIAVQYSEINGSFTDGEPYSLRQPAYVIQDPYYALPGNLLISPRFGPPVFGLGLLEAISESDILTHADAADANSDGISGRPNYVWDAVSQSVQLGRFGWKANQPNLMQQTAAAYNGDMGITTTLFSGENCTGQPQCDTLSDDPELSDSILEATVFYVRTLGVPARRNVEDREVQAGKKLFTQAHCAACHIPEMHTGTLPGIPEVSGQTIFPYTDLLLHDMGSDLADNRPDFLADGKEWRTPPLWGIGLTMVVNGHTQLLHDGRARNLKEAILWHGGEAQGARTAFINMSATQRAALLAFLNSL